MIGVRNGRITWAERDVVRMVNVIGHDNASDEWAPYNPSILRSAQHERLHLNRAARAALKNAWEWVRACRALRALADVQPTNALERRAWAHQRVDIHYMVEAARDSYLLAHQPGVGKTLEAIGWAVRRKARRTLVICPASARYQWRREIRRYARLVWPDLRVRVMDGTIGEQARTVKKSGWVIAHWEALVHAADPLMAQEWDMVIADEAHWAQNRNAKRSETLHDLTYEAGVAITAHPYTNQPDELYSILKFLDPVTYSSFWRFWGQHVLVVPRHFGGFDVLGTRDAKLLKWELTPFTLRRTNASLGRVPIRRIVRTATLTAKARAEYDKLRRQLFVSLEGLDGNDKVLMVPNILARTMRLRQYLIDPGMLGAKMASVKYPLVAEVLTELDGPPVIFTAFKKAALALQAYLTKQRRTIDVIHGGMGKKQEPVKRSFLRGELDALIVVSKAGGESLNLGRYGYVFHLDLPWNPRTLEQTEGRVDRPEEGTGRMVPTTAYHFVVEESYEQRQIERLQRKHSSFREVFTARDLRALFEE